MRINCLLGFLISVFCFPLVQVSDVQAQPVAGNQEIEGSANFFRPLGQRAGTFNADLAYGLYLDNPAWQVGIRQSYNLLHDRDRSDLWSLTTVPYLDYHFLGWEQWVPFVGGFVGATYNDRDITGTIGPQAGIKAFISPSTFVSFRYRYEWFFDKLRSSDVRDTSGANHVGTIGIGYTWG